MPQLTDLSQQSPWVEESLGAMSLDQKIGQLLHPCIHPSASEADREQLLGDIEPGGLFLFSGTHEQFTQTTQWFQERAPIPLVISSDLENGAGRIISGATTFPGMMALSATDDEALAYEMGRAAAVEGRAFGVHWAFAPVVDVNINPFSPGTNTRSLGDDPQRVARLAKAIIRGMQENGLCATVKHFPGGGADDRDQHICNTINPLRMDQWFKISGHPFQSAIDEGVWSVMIGHISLPACDPGAGDHIQNAPPATLSRRILVDLLRQQMGFQGVIITDAMDMGGVRAFGRQEEIVPATIAAGCDMILFSNAQEDFQAIKQALDDGRLTVARIEASVRRILALKAALGLHQGLETKPVTASDRARSQQASYDIAEKAITLVRDRHQILPLDLGEGTRVLSYHFRGDPDIHVDTFDDMLRERGVDVVRFDEREQGKLHGVRDFNEFDAIIISGVMEPSWGTSRIRPAGNFMRDIWALINSHHPKLILVSYGSPYLVYEMPHMPCVINGYSPDVRIQEMVLKALIGDLVPTATSPVNLEAPYLFKSAEGLRYRV